MVEALSTRGFVSGSKSFTEDLRDQRHLAHLGDAVLECVVRFHLHNMHHDWPLSVITSANQKLITAKALHEVAVYLELPKYLLHRQADQASERVLAETVEALIGAVFFNDGFDAASAFTMRILQDSGTWEVAVNPPEN